MQWAALTALAVMGLASSAAADPQSPGDASTPSAARARLFEAVEPLALTLTADFGALGKNRGNDKPDHPAVLSYTTPTGDSVTMDVQLHTRGHFRLNTCQYPPLKVVFDREKTQHTMFAHQGSSLKLIVQCRGGKSYANYLLEEYLIYRVYNLITDRGFRARLAHVTYVDAKGKHEPETRWAFFLEDDDRMAKRNNMEVLVQKGVYQTDLDFHQIIALVT